MTVMCCSVVLWEWQRRYRKQRASDLWPLAEAEIIDSVVTEDRRGRYRLRVRYKYAAGGKLFEDSRLRFVYVPSFVSYEAAAECLEGSTRRGGVISIRYNPAMPSESVVLSGSSLGMLVLPALVGVVWVLGALIVLQSF